ncbi:uncharacterized protein LOC143807851 [Ranitomeya variabilis]|uniref:uncharacterized protein LOC143807851 n=1 Tax=Ranitomeya variabilis TaxID=490064 RepID=UPI004057BC13
MQESQNTWAAPSCFRGPSQRPPGSGMPSEAPVEKTQIPGSSSQMPVGEEGGRRPTRRTRPPERLSMELPVRGQQRRARSPSREQGPGGSRRRRPMAVSTPRQPGTRSGLQGQSHQQDTQGRARQANRTRDRRAISQHSHGSQEETGDEHAEDGRWSQGTRGPSFRDADSGGEEDSRSTAAGGRMTPARPVAAVSGVGPRGGRRGPTLPSRIMERGIWAAEPLIKASVTSRTWAAYGRSWGQWEQWLGRGDEDMSEEEQIGVLLMGIRQAADDSWSAAKMSQLIAGLAFGFKLRNRTDLTKSFLVRQALKGYRKGKVNKDNRRPVSFGMLEVLGEQLEGVCRTQFEVGLFRLAFSLAFFGAMRIGELVAPGKAIAGGILAEDVIKTKRGLEFWIRRSKTDQRGKGKRVLLGRVSGSMMCPCKCFGIFSAARPKQDGPLLCHEDGSYLSRYQFIKVFRTCMVRAGGNPGRYTGHSFRIGAATEAAVGGLSPETVKRIGRWESRRYRSYVRPQGYEAAIPPGINASH